MSVKLAYWLSDLSQPGRGNLTLIPGSHRTNWLPGPPQRNQPWPPPNDAQQITVAARDAVLFDRRIWHARTTNTSPITRKSVFLSYPYRWITIRDNITTLPTQPWWHQLNPIQQQLLGGTGHDNGDHAWGHYPNDTPLYQALRQQGLLTPDS